MSVKMTGLVWDSPLPRDKKFLMLCYADHADHYGESIYPAKTTVERMTGYSRRSVQTITAELVRDGLLIERGTSHLGTMSYAMNLDALEALPRGGANSARAQKTASEGRKKQQNGGANSAPNPSLEPPLHPPSNGAPAGELFADPEIEHPEIPPAVRSPELLAAWAEWKQHRKEKRQPLTALAMKKQVADLAGWVAQGRGPGLAIAAIEHSIKNGYTGLFLPKANPTAAKASQNLRGPITPDNALQMPQKR